MILQNQRFWNNLIMQWTQVLNIVLVLILATHGPNGETNQLHLLLHLKFKRQYSSIVGMMSKNGFGWDESKYMVMIEENEKDVRNNYVKVCQIPMPSHYIIYQSCIIFLPIYPPQSTWSCGTSDVWQQQLSSHIFGENKERENYSGFD